MSFVVFCLVVISVPLAISSYLTDAMDPQEVSLDILKGTVLLQERGAKFEVNAAGQSGGDSKSIRISEGDSFRTVEGSQAVLWLFDGSNVLLWPDTAITVEQLRLTKYNSNRAAIHLRQQTGHARLEVAPPGTKSRHLEVVTPEAAIVLREGSFSIGRGKDMTEMVTRQGSSTVTGANRSVELLQHERTEVRFGSKPLDPLPATRNLIRNGDFNDRLDVWQLADRSEPVDEPIPAAATLETQDGRTVLGFRREGAKKHWEKYIFQPIEKDITDFNSVKLSFELKLANQSLSGGGVLGSEYPLLIRLKYRDVYNSEVTFVRGFYYQNEDRNPTLYGQEMARNEWQSVEIDLFDPEGRLTPRPAFLLWLEVAASGHSYESYVTNIRLIAE
ncbi:MAG: FecR domain-containing protein [Chloroflexi bacterium]|nr:FecR domain-containing protein [Chloroflexota bacterium]